MALIDEADSILIDEARTPLILSQSRVNVQQQRYLGEALELADAPATGRRFSPACGRGQSAADRSGREQIAAQAGAMGGVVVGPPSS